MEKINADIRRAHTLPAEFYRSPEWFERSKEDVFARAWHYAGESSQLPQARYAWPFVLLPGVLDEPLLLVRDEAGRIRCMSNVCTHRGNILIQEAGSVRQLSCGYHGRCFHLDGHFKRMPAFEAAEHFPAPEDHLSQLPVAEWLGLLFTSLQPYAPFAEAVQPIVERVNFLPLSTLEYLAEGSADHYVDAHWALYCDNYLEGFHVPFVHPALNESLDFGQYDYETFAHCNLQIGIAKEGEPAFVLPEGHPDYGRRVYAYYFFLFPNLMFNFYPWGLSLNVVEPLSKKRTKVLFRSFAFRGSHHKRAANNIDQTELEDEQVVESVQRGIQSRLYRRGRFSPSMERCVHHFHRRLSESFR